MISPEFRVTENPNLEAGFKNFVCANYGKLDMMFMCVKATDFGTTCKQNLAERISSDLKSAMQTTIGQIQNNSKSSKTCSTSKRAL